jgi:large repetitive protein
MMACLTGRKLNGCSPYVAIPDWPIIIKDSLGNFHNTSTNYRGVWEACGLANGTYTICEGPESGWGQTSSPVCYNVTLEGVNVSGLDFTNQELRCISGYKINNSTGKGEAGWNITLQNKTVTTSLLTGADGRYEFCNLKPGEYNLTEETLPGYMAMESVSNPFALGCENITNKNFTNLFVIASINLKKYTNGYDADDVTGPYIPVNGSVTWRYVVTSDSNVPLSNITVTDSRPGKLCERRQQH